MTTNTRSIKRLKQDANKLKKEEGIELYKALDLVAQNIGYESWKLVNEKTIDGKVEAYLPISIESCNENLNKQNRELLVKHGIDFSILTITATGIKKSIMDAIGTLRHFLDEKEFHSYEQQKQGKDYKKEELCGLIVPEHILTKKISLYRPTTKNGDPRIWVYGLKDYVQPDDELAFFFVDKYLYVLNLNRTDLSYFSELLSRAKNILDGIAIELRDKLIKIAKKPLKAIMNGDTAIGMTIEHRLGLPANSSKKPDYKGIELKSGRVTKNSTRKSLFAQVPRWDFSPLKSSAEIIDKYGYERKGDLRLYCTLDAVSFNSQGLKLLVNLKEDRVYEMHKDDGVIAIWEGKTLRERLLTKHYETFWISAEVELIDNVEYYNLKSFTHTKNPLSHQLLPLIMQGVITLDHLIKRKNKIEAAKEKGPFFKIKPQALDKLFQEPVVYSLFNIEPQEIDMFFPENIDYSLTED